ncbi:GNAT family N-acetyltransferase [Bradyrhizobium manausense]|uniref:GNAT family N-acetyltransferase n=1 Tax=Bradyrhizobium manausense TaxID=989370 RepID=UPI001BA84ABF|nr:GNAT family N-acetyltransferase [Bradyrhizobium manausense]MBR0689747.1 GNAT family N-acetyltransferase [Bradyrhizobium manausense]MBR0720381.1 GNAT family N-acetyltransferase [Bradyrhizobium manausense]MBR0834840.1 GNAT family N-acetyltransferase [Bradyrhizobium manausense]
MSQLSLDAAVELHQAKAMVRIRTANASDVEGLSIYFTGLSATTRNKRFMGARADVALLAAECIAKVSHPNHFTLLAELRQEEGPSTIIGETRYAYDAAARHGDFAISVADVFQRTGVGLQMVTAMERRASDLGHEMIAAETARTNAEMRGLAKKAGFADTGLGDWQSIHFAKRLSR